MDNATKNTRPNLNDPIYYAIVKEIHFYDDSTRDTDLEEWLDRSGSKLKNNIGKR